MPFEIATTDHGHVDTDPAWNVDLGTVDGVAGSLRRRLGDLVVTHRDLGVWWGVESEEPALIGMHGGLSPAEMLVAFAAAPATVLR